MVVSNSNIFLASQQERKRSCSAVERNRASAQQRCIQCRLGATRQVCRFPPFLPALTGIGEIKLVNR